MKKQLLKSALIAAIGFSMLTGSASADELSLQQILNERTWGGTSSINTATEMLSDSIDSAWTITATGGSVNALVIELAGYKDSTSFGIYDLSNPTKILQIFSGSADISNQLSAKKTLYNVGNTFYTYYIDDSHTDAINFSNNNFGYYIYVAAVDKYYYSESSRNSGNEDHMYAYQGENDKFNIANTTLAKDYKLWTENEYILAWEDLAINNTSDFNDFVVMVESVTPVPEPATMLLFGTGIAGLAGIARRKRPFKA